MPLGAWASAIVSSSPTAWRHLATSDGEVLSFGKYVSASRGMHNPAHKYIKRRTAKAAATNKGTSHMAAVIHESAAVAQDFQYGVRGIHISYLLRKTWA
jgi:hypothetical protein